MSQKFDRFKDAPWFQVGVRPTVLIGGAGGIGSWLTLSLNRAGFETYVFDYDMLEQINMAGQAFPHNQIGKSKVEALAQVVRDFCQEEIIPFKERLTDKSMTNDIVFSAFDNMKARRDMFNSWIATHRGNPLAIFIDGRLTAEQITVFCVRGNDEDAIFEYATDHLFSDFTVEEAPCTLKQTTHNAMGIAWKMTEYFVNWYAGVVGRDPSRKVQFYHLHYAPLDYTESRPANKRPNIEATSSAIDFFDMLTTEEVTEHPKVTSSFNVTDFSEPERSTVISPPLPGTMIDPIEIDEDEDEYEDECEEEEIDNQSDED